MGAGRSERPAAAEYRNSILTEKLHAGAGGVAGCAAFSQSVLQKSTS